MHIHCQGRRRSNDSGDHMLSRSQQYAVAVKNIKDTRKMWINRIKLRRTTKMVSGLSNLVYKGRRAEIDSIWENRKCNKKQQPFKYIKNRKKKKKRCKQEAYITVLHYWESRSDKNTTENPPIHRGQNRLCSKRLPNLSQQSYTLQSI